MPTTRTYSGKAGVGDLLKAALPALPVVGSLPGISKTKGYDGFVFDRPPVTVTHEMVQPFAEVCGFLPKDQVPPPYPHLLVFPLQLKALGDRAFPAPAMGMVHLDNSISHHRPIRFGETLEAQMTVGEGIPHPAGTAYRFEASVHSEGELVWEETSTYLSRGKRNPDVEWPDTYERVPAALPVWSLPANLGRRYGAVSGDINPIHLSALSARALGFKRQIAHGYWTMARSVAALDGRLPDAVKVEASFRKPLFLPSKVAFGAQPTGEGYAFSLTKAGSDTIHLLGRTTAL
ncbi:MaoC/PaaZ C-terminal domain-containing protein [Nocardioides sp. Kera G14]|uniref:MaoC/PaaZ C-terminal domain-containing protein n=1 Tax=Nocardioides sp. Kera G14 TaxID=2884264 RepID=UPI001D1285E5|nr:MaoC/PaaZ C-terminal domain-containing protein [Nocardioides sp. Kera G14]UDY22330.1 hypothetical protein LH076_09575 [Nocardioides sp. Kera G14]